MTASSSGLNINAKEWRSNFASVKPGKIICQFFAMGGCRHGSDCPYSHELTQEAPEGVDSSAGFFISGRVANLGAQTAVQPETKRTDTDPTFSGAPLFDSQRPSDVYCPPPAPPEIVYSTPQIQSVAHGPQSSHGNFQIPSPSYENQHHDAEGNDNRNPPTGHHFFQHGQQIQSMYTSSLGQGQTENFYQVYAQSQSNVVNHTPVTMIYNQNQKFSLPPQVQGPEVGYSPTYPLQTHTPTIVDQTRFVGHSHNHQLPLSGPTTHYVENAAPIQSTQLYYHAETGSYVVRQPSQVQLTRPASYPSLTPQVHTQNQSQPQYYVSGAVQVSKHAGTPTTYNPVQASYPQAAQHLAAPAFGQLPHQIHSVAQTAGVSPTLHQPTNYHTGFSSPSYQHPTVQVGAAPPGGSSTHAAFFNNNNEAIRQSYQVPSGPSHYLGVEQFAPQLVHDSRRTSGSSLREEYGGASSGGSSPIPTHTGSIEIAIAAPAMLRGPPPVVPKSIDDDGDDECMTSNAHVRGRSGKMMMAPTPLS